MIWAKGLSRTFGKSQAVQSLDLDVKRGEVFGVLGPNGAGKSTTSRMLTTLLKPSSGEARVANFDPVSEPLQVRRRIGFLPDELPVYGKRTATEFLTLFARMHGISRRQTRGRIQELLERVGLRDVAGKQVGRFSKGMKQRLGLARALLADPQVLFLDEPASGLDPMGRKEIRELIKDIARSGATVFMCSHDLAEVQDVCQRVAILNGGVVVRELTLKGRVRQVLRLELEAPVEGLRQALFALPNLALAQRRSNQYRLEFAGPVDAREVARAVHRTGAVLLAIHEEHVDLERTYREAMKGFA